MRRVDVVRQVLVGGKATSRMGSGNTSLVGESETREVQYESNSASQDPPYYTSDSTYYLTVEQAALVTPYDSFLSLGVDKGYLYIDDDTTAISGYMKRFDINVKKDSTYPDEADRFVDGDIGGVFQKIGKERAHWGLEFFNNGTGTNGDGGTIKDPIGSNVIDMATSIQNTSADTWTPLAEAYYVCMMYFRQASSLTDLYVDGTQVSAFSNTYPNTAWKANRENEIVDPYWRKPSRYYQLAGAAKMPVPCAKSFVILLTDGQSTQDRNVPSELKDFDGDSNDDFTPATGYSGVFTDSNRLDYTDSGSNYLDDLALFARTNDLREDLDGDQNLILYTIYAFGDQTHWQSLQAIRDLKDAARNGGFEDMNGNNFPDLQEEWDVDEDGAPDTFFNASDGYELEDELLAAITDILRRASSGTAVSVLATSSEGEGTLVQAYFRPTITIGTEDVDWVGYLHALWVDSLGRIREDTPPTGNQPGLVLSHDKIVEFFFDAATGEAGFARFDVDVDGDKVFNDLDGDGIKGDDESYQFTEHKLDELKPIWEAGAKLHTRDPYDRTIYTYVDLDLDNSVLANPSDENNEFVYFSENNLSVVRPFFGVSDSSYAYLGETADNRAANLIKFVLGDDEYSSEAYPRNRDINGNPWKLGDIVHSTPVTLGRPLDNYGLIYGDQTYQNYYAEYRDRESVVYVGGNDGMLHCFYMGKYQSGDDPDTAAHESIYFIKQEESVADFGEEVWGYIPQAVLPHLKWLASPDYTHVYYVDLKPRLVDARIFEDDDLHPNGWGTVLLGGLNLGGREISVTDSFPEGPNKTRNFTASYFALDVTDPFNPVLLWEKAYPDMGLSTNQPTVGKVGDSWFVFFGSGPDDCDGASGRTGHMYVADLLTGALLQDFETDEDDAIMGSPITVDYGLNYNVDLGYIGESYDQGSSRLGKMYRLHIPKTSGDWRTAAAADVYDDNPAHWTFSCLADVDGPALAPPAASIDDLLNVWVYFGTGRYLSEDDKLDSTTQYFYGIKDPYFNGTLYDTEDDALGQDPSRLDLLDATPISVYTDGTVSGTGFVDTWAELLGLAREKDGWELTLGTESENIGERILNKPSVLGGIVFDTTFVPNYDPCGYGGNSNLVGVYYETGTAYQSEVFSDGSTLVNVDGETKSEVSRKIDVGVGQGSSVSIHVGQQDGATGYVQQSTGIVEAIDLTPAFNIRSGFIYWRHR